LYYFTYFFPACPKKPKKPTGLGFLKKPGFLNPAYFSLVICLSVHIFADN